MIEQEVRQARQSMGDEVAAFKSRMAGAIDHVVSAIQGTVSNVKSAVCDTTECVKDSVKESLAQVNATLNVADHIRQQPWPAVGGAVVTGIVSGYLLRPADQARTSTSSGNSDNSPRRQPTSVEPVYAPPKKPGVWDDLLDRLRSELMTLGETAITTVSSALRTSLNRGIDQLVANQFATKSTEVEQVRGSSDPERQKT